jgi:hypothetical protein
MSGTQSRGRYRPKAWAAVALTFAASCGSPREVVTTGAGHTEISTATTTATTAAAAAVSDQPKSGESETPSALDEQIRQMEAEVAESPLAQFVRGEVSARDFFLMMDLAVSECMSANGFRYQARTVEQIFGQGTNPNDSIRDADDLDAAGKWSQALAGLAKDAQGVDVKGGCQEVSNQRMLVMNSFPTMTAEIDVFLSTNESVADAEKMLIDKYRDQILAWRANWPTLEKAGK